MAHIGVLPYFEEHHIPINKIEGTSIGGLIGGIYAIIYATGTASAGHLQ